VTAQDVSSPLHIYTGYLEEKKRKEKKNPKY
jgi:hypothetical protein